ncbi:hypothetical protein R1sor_023173 [Riccia sorocarpa]|uniref:Uncharacterized protein n=1 Tax=Riccia sorocarpa TaxID=122646 RepID=A0ABD3GP15_9MARC
MADPLGMVTPTRQSGVHMLSSERYYTENRPTSNSPGLSFASLSSTGRQASSGSFKHPQKPIRDHAIENTEPST